MLIFGKITSILSISFISIALISGCGTAGTKKADPSAHQSAMNDDKVYAAEKGLSTKQRFSKALQYLEHGQVGQASAELRAYIAVRPSAKVNDLLVQTTMDPTEYFPAESFPVKLTSGESLSTLSRDYLGTALQFYALARYNNISNPSKVNIGQTINVPMTKFAIAARDKAMMKSTEIESDSTSIVETSKTMSEKTEEQVQQKSDTKTVKPVANEKTVMADITKLVNDKDYKTAISKVKELEKFGDLTRSGRKVALTAFLASAKNLAYSDRVKAADYYANAGDINLINGNSLKAFRNFKTASDLDPENSRAMGEILVLQKDISESYHREASTAYRNQKLDLAISKWDIVLEVDPDHDAAQRFRATAVELKERLAKIRN